MKKNYEKPEVELEKFQVEEVLTGSTGSTGSWEDSKPDDMNMGM